MSADEGRSALGVKGSRQREGAQVRHAISLALSLRSPLTPTALAAGVGAAPPLSGGRAPTGHDGDRDQLRKHEPTALARPVG